MLEDQRSGRPTQFFLAATETFFPGISDQPFSGPGKSGLRFIENIWSSSHVAPAFLPHTITLLVVVVVVVVCSPPGIPSNPCVDHSRFPQDSTAGT